MISLAIGELFEVEKGTLQSSKNVEGEFTFITAGEDWKTHISYTHDCEALVFAMGASGSLGRTHYIGGKFVASDLCFILAPLELYRNKIDLKFYHNLFNYLRSDIVRNTATGTSKLAINFTNFKNYRIPYFDISLQLKLRTFLEDIKGNNGKLNLELENQTKLIAQLRQAILQEGVQGKLVSQDSTDEPASELLKRIKAEKERLIWEKKIKKEKPSPPITEDEIPYELPKSWLWVRLGDITLIILGQSPPSETYNTVGEGLPFYQGKSNFGKIYPTPTQWCSEPNKIAEKGDVLISVRAPVGPTNICNEESCIGRGLAAIRMIEGVPNFYILYTLRAVERIISGSGFGTTFIAITGDDLNSLLVPLSPLKEQKRIVAKVDELMELCDELEVQIRQSKEDSVRLMQAVLQEAFEGKYSEESDQEMSVA